MLAALSLGVGFSHNKPDACQSKLHSSLPLGFFPSSLHHGGRRRRAWPLPAEHQPSAPPAPCPRGFPLLTSLLPTFAKLERANAGCWRRWQQCLCKRIVEAIWKRVDAKACALSRFARDAAGELGSSVRLASSGAGCRSSCPRCLQ